MEEQVQTVGERAIGMEMQRFLEEKLSQTKGELTDDVRRSFAERFPQHSKIPGPTIGAVRKRLGFPTTRSHRQADSALPDVPEATRRNLSDLGRICAEYQKLLDRESVLEGQLAEIKKSIAEYKPIINAVNGLTGVMENYRASLRREESSKRGNGSPV